MATGAAVPWDTCAENGCLGARIGAGPACLLHASPEAVARHQTFTGLGVDLDARGVRFTGESLEQVLELVPLDASGRRLLGRVQLDRATFTRGVAFDDTTFVADVCMAGAVFQRDARFGGAVFAAAVDFSEATFEGQAWFLGASFAGPASFGGVTFTGPAWFRQASFAGPACFDGARFSADANFPTASFATDASFADATFAGHARFEGATCAGGWRFDGARFLLRHEGPPASAPSAVPAAPTPLDLPLPPTAKAPARAAPRLSRQTRIRVLTTVLSVSLIGTVAFVVLRPDPARSKFRDYAFLLQDVKTDRPARYNPCEPLRYVVNAKAAPPEGMAAVEQAVAEVTRATGITFQGEGTTEEEVKLQLPADEKAISGGKDAATTAASYSSLFGRPSFQPGRYGRDRWAPVLIGWQSFEPQNVSYSSNIIGVGASDPRQIGDEIVWVSGNVVLNSDVRVKNLKTVLMHELGHVMGLAHVDSTTDLMAREDEGLPGWGEGDLEGLRQLGRSMGCLPTPAPGT